MSSHCPSALRFCLQLWVCFFALPLALGCATMAIKRQGGHNPEFIRRHHITATILHAALGVWLAPFLALGGGEASQHWAAVKRQGTCGTGTPLCCPFSPSLLPAALGVCLVTPIALGCAAAAIKRQDGNNLDDHPAIT